MSFYNARRGDKLKISAGEWNAVRSAVLSQQLPAGSASRAFALDGSVFVKNTTDTDVPRFGVLKVNGPIITPADNEAEFVRRVTIAGAAPVAGDPFVVCTTPIAAGAIGRGVLSGVTIAKVNFTDGDEGYAFVEDDEYGHLNAAHANYAGCRVLWSPGSSGDQYAIVHIGEDARTFLVWLTQTGGSAGSVSTACTFTYSVFSDAVKANQIGTAVAPEHARPALGPMVAASIGLAVIIGGELKLWWTDEVPDVEACPS